MFAGKRLRVCKPTGYVKQNMNDSDAVEELFALNKVKNPKPL